MFPSHARWHGSNEAKSPTYRTEDVFVLQPSKPFMFDHPPSTVDGAGRDGTGGAGGEGVGPGMAYLQLFSPLPLLASTDWYHTSKAVDISASISGRTPDKSCRSYGSAVML